MSETVRWSSGQPRRQESNGDGSNLADILERVLDKGIVIAGDIQVNLLDIELLTIKIRLVVASVDRAKEMGIDWWERDPTLSAGRQDLEDENVRLRRRIETLEQGTLGPGDRNGGVADDETADEEFADELDDEVPEDEPELDDEPEGGPVEEPEPEDSGGPRDEPTDGADGDRRAGTRRPARRREPAERPARRRARGGDR